MLAFGKHEVDFFSVMAASAFVQLLSSAVPLPGGTGGAEGGFALFLGHFFGSAATAGYLLWRLYHVYCSYYPGGAASGS